MSAFILMVLISTSNGEAAFSQEFNSKPACEAALKVMKKTAPTISRVRGACVSKVTGGK